MLNQARSDLAKQELHVESLIKCIGELQRQTEEQRLALQDAQYGFVESGREQVRLQEELSTKEKVLRNTQIRNMHEMAPTQERLSSGRAVARRALIHCGRTWEEQVVEKHEVKESQRKADKGRGEQRRWRVHAEENKKKPGEL